MNKKYELPAEWDYYFNMSLLETMEFIYVNEIFIDYDEYPDYISVSTILKAPARKEKFLLMYHKKAEIK